MPTQNKDTDQQNIRDNTGNTGTGDHGGTGEGAARQGSQQPEMPPSETDDDQYDQGTVKRST